MTDPRTVRLAGLVCALAAPAAAQTRATAGFDLGASRVHYDDFLPSYSTFVSADVRAATRATSITARATALRFESGRSSLHGSLAASQLIPTRGSVRAELSATAGASRYAGFAGFAHGLGRVRLHHAGRDRGEWAGLTLGATSFGTGSRPVAQVAAGVWTPVGRGALDASLARTSVGDTAYTDAETFLRVPVGRVLFDGWVGARLWSRGAGRGVYVEASVTMPLPGPFALIASGGRYPTDPIRGSIAGRYASLGLRVAGRRAPRPGPQRPVAPPAAHGSNGAPLVPLPAVEVTDGTEAGVRTLRVSASGALAVEVMGDFTDWRPVALAPAGPDRWEVTLAMPPGARRVNVRIDGGPWIAPRGATRILDEFGAEVGVLVVP